MIGTNIIKGITLATALAVGSACAGVRKTTTDVNPNMNRAPTCAAAIAVYNSRADVPYDYYELAWIEAEATPSGPPTTNSRRRSEMAPGRSALMP